MANPLGQMHKTDAEARKSMNAFYLVLDLWMSPGGGAVGPGRVREYLGNPQVCMNCSGVLPACYGGVRG